MKNIIPREKAYNNFLELRGKVLKSVDGRGESSFSKVFLSIKEQAKKGDCIAQDVLAYFYKNGIDFALREDYRKYLFWEFLAGANGNEFAIEKLQFMFCYAYDTIVDDSNFGQIKYNNNIDEYNYIGIIGQYICDELVMALDIDEKKLAESMDSGESFNLAFQNEIRKTIDYVVPRVIERMKSKGSGN